MTRSSRWGLRKWLVLLTAGLPASAFACSNGTDASGGGTDASANVDSAYPQDGVTAHEAAATPSDASIGQDGASANEASADGPHTKVLDIISVGDSITRDTCWRALLWNELHQSFPTRFHLVGTLNFDPGCSVAGYETANQGYASSLVTEVVAGITTARTCDPFCPTLSDLTTAFTAVKPDVMLMHYGTNDVWNGIASSSIVNAYSAVIDAVRSVNPNVVILLAQIIPMNVTSATCSGCSCASCPTAVPALNSAIAGWAPTKSTAASPIVVVDQYTGFDAVTDTRDGVHPNATGSQKMAVKWYAALMPLF